MLAESINVNEAIKFPAEIVKVQTMQDGAIRITFDLPAGELEAATQLIEAKQRGAVLEVAAIALINNKEQYAISEGSKRKSKWTTAEK